jgi:transaldolase
MTKAANRIQEIEAIGQSIWMDNLTRDLIQSGELKELIDKRGILGITSNPAIFEKAIAGNKMYDADIEAGIKAKKSTIDIYESLIFDDIRKACDIFKPVYDSSKYLDGYISIEVTPTIANDTEKTIAEAKRYHKAIGKPNVMVKIPGTKEGLPAVEAAIAEGINVNVTLLFSVQSYVDCAWAYISGLEKRLAAGQDISKVASVASFFLSRIDSHIDGEIDKKLKRASDIVKKAKLESIKGKVAIANAKIAYQKYKEIIESDRWKALAAKGAKPQRLLWASTSTKNPKYPDVMYVDELVGPGTVNTLPPNTIEACADHCNVDNRIETGIDKAYALMKNLKDPEIKINIDKVMNDLLIDGIDKFVTPFQSLIESLENKATKLAKV